jgi:hypothetical protein
MATETGVRGLAAAKATFEQTPAVFRDRLNSATELTVREIARQAQGFLERSPSIETRSLYNAVGWSMNTRTGHGRAGVQSVVTNLGRVGRLRLRLRGAIVTTRGGKERIINPRRYAHLVEFGSRKMRAEPFMRPAAEAETQPYLDRCQAAARAAERDLSHIGSRTL